MIKPVLTESQKREYDSKLKRKKNEAANKKVGVRSKIDDIRYNQNQPKVNAWD